MATEAAAERRSVGHKLADLFHGRERLQVGALLAGPVGWLVIGYLGSLALLLVAAFWSVDPLSGLTEKSFTLENFEALWNEPVYRDIAWRTIRTALLVTITAAVIAFPIAFYMAKVASPRVRRLLVIAVLMPLWSSYLVKVYSWRIIIGGWPAAGWACAAPASARAAGNIARIRRRCMGVWSSWISRRPVCHARRPR